MAAKRVRANAAVAEALERVLAAEAAWPSSHAASHSARTLRNDDRPRNNDVGAGLTHAPGRNPRQSPLGSALHAQMTDEEAPGRPARRSPRHELQSGCAVPRPAVARRGQARPVTGAARRRAGARVPRARERKGRPEKRRPLQPRHGRGRGATGPLVPDPVVQSAPGTFSMPGPGASFEGVDNVDGVLPPDPNGAVGPDHY